MSGDPMFSAEEIERLLCAVYPTKAEERLERAAAWCWDHRAGWVGDRLDSIRWRSNRRRAARKARR